MNFKKIFALADEKGIKPLELKYSSATALSINVFNEDLEGYQISNDSSIFGRGIFDGKLGSFSSDRVDSKIGDEMVSNIIANAKYGNPGDPDFFISKGKKYKKVHSFSEGLDAIKPEELIDLAMDISKGILAKEKRITVVNVSVERKGQVTELYNSNGLKLKSKTNYLVLGVSTKIEDNGQIESFFKYGILDDIKAFDKDAYIAEIVEKTINKLGGITVKSGKYNVVYDWSVIPSLLGPMLDQLSGFAVQQHLSRFEGKLGEKVFSSKLTVKENPFTKSLFGSAFDAEGMPTMKKDLISKGVVKTFVYDLETGKKEGVASTGNGQSSMGNVRPGLTFIEVKKGSKSLDELFAQIGDGLYITDLEGIGTGYNTQSGDYSLQAGGFVIEKGKLGKPVTLITVAGNVFTDFGKIIGVGSDSHLSIQGMETPSIAIKKLAVSGK